MQPQNYRFLNFLIRQEEGSIAVSFAFLSLAILVFFAFAVDAGRGLSLKGHLDQMAVGGVKYAASIYLFRDEAEVISLTQQYISDLAEKQEMPFVSLNGLTTTVSISSGAEISTATVTVARPFSHSLLNQFGYSDGQAMSSQAKVRIRLKPSNIALVLDGSLESQSVGHVASFKQGVTHFLGALSLLNEQENTVAVSLLNHMSDQVSVRPFASWVAETEWPFTSVPPAVPGVSEWTGPLADQRWCVGVRDGGLGAGIALPSEGLFPLVLDISVQEREAELPLFRIATDDGCPDTPIHPLTPDFRSLQSSLDTSVARGQARPDRGLIWARRLVAESWQTELSSDWIRDNTAEKMIIMLVGSAPQLSLAASVDLLQSCSVLMTEGISFYVINWSDEEDWIETLQPCLPPEQYRRVQSQSEFETALADIAKGLIDVQLTSLH